MPIAREFSRSHNYNRLSSRCGQQGTQLSSRSGCNCKALMQASPLTATSDLHGYGFHLRRTPGTWWLLTPDWSQHRSCETLLTPVSGADRSSAVRSRQTPVITT